MVSKFLLPNRFKLIGWILLIPSFIVGVLWFWEFAGGDMLTGSWLASIMISPILVSLGEEV